MAFFFGDSFDLYALPADALLGYWDSGTTQFTLAAGRFSGSRGISNPGATGAAWLVKSSGQNDGVHHIVCAIQQTTAIAGSNVHYYFQLSDGATNQVCICFRGDGAIELRSATAAGTVLATYTGAITASSTWYAFEFEVVIHNTAGSFAVRKNGNTSNDFSATSLNTRPGANAYANKLTIGNNSSTNSQTLDDLLWRSDAASVAWAGDIRCYTRRPDTDASAQWSRGTPTINFSAYTGNTTAQGTATNGARYTPFTSQGGTIGSVILTTTNTGTINVKCALFNDNNGQPGTVIQSATAAINNPTLGANTFTFSPAVTIPNGNKFWVGVICDNVVTGFWATAATAPFSTAGFSSTVITYASWPQNNPASLSAAANTNAAPVVTANNNANWVGEQQQDAAVSYVYSSTPGQADFYNITAIDSTPLNILGVVTRGLMQKSDAGTRTASVRNKSGPTIHGGTVTALNTSWGWLTVTDLADPNTGGSWSAVAVNNLQIGMILSA